MNCSTTIASAADAPVPYLLTAQAHAAIGSTPNPARPSWPLAGMAISYRPTVTLDGARATLAIRGVDGQPCEATVDLWAARKLYAELGQALTAEPNVGRGVVG